MGCLGIVFLALFVLDPVRYLGINFVACLGLCNSFCANTAIPLIKFVRLLFGFLLCTLNRGCFVYLNQIFNKGKTNVGRVLYVTFLRISWRFIEFWGFPLIFQCC